MPARHATKIGPAQPESSTPHRAAAKHSRADPPAKPICKVFSCNILQYGNLPSSAADLLDHLQRLPDGISCANTALEYTYERLSMGAPPNITFLHNPGRMTPRHRLSPLLHPPGNSPERAQHLGR
jgi:hypothetical protein